MLTSELNIELLFEGITHRLHRSLLASHCVSISVRLKVNICRRTVRLCTSIDLTFILTRIVRITSKGDVYGIQMTGGAFDTHCSTISVKLNYVTHAIL